MPRNSSRLAVLRDSTDSSLHGSVLGLNESLSPNLSIEKESVLLEDSNVSLQQLGELSFLDRVRLSADASNISSIFHRGHLDDIRLRKRKRKPLNVSNSSETSDESLKTSDGSSSSINLSNLDDSYFKKPFGIPLKRTPSKSKKSRKAPENKTSLVASGKSPEEQSKISKSKVGNLGKVNPRKVSVNFLPDESLGSTDVSLTESPAAPEDSRGKSGLRKVSVKLAESFTDSECDSVNLNVTPNLTNKSNNISDDSTGERAPVSVRDTSVHWENSEEESENSQIDVSLNNVCTSKDNYYLKPRKLSVHLALDDSGSESKCNSEEPTKASLSLRDTVKPGSQKKKTISLEKKLLKKKLARNKLDSDFQKSTLRRSKRHLSSSENQQSDSDLLKNESEFMAKKSAGLPDEIKSQDNMISETFSDDIDLNSNASENLKKENQNKSVQKKTGRKSVVTFSDIICYSNITADSGLSGSKPIKPETSNRNSIIVQSTIPENSDLDDVENMDPDCSSVDNSAMDITNIQPDFCASMHTSPKKMLGSRKVSVAFGMDTTNESVSTAHLHSSLAMSDISKMSFDLSTCNDKENEFVPNKTSHSFNKVSKKDEKHILAKRKISLHFDLDNTESEEITCKEMDNSFKYQNIPGIVNSVLDKSAIPNQCSKKMLSTDNETILSNDADLSNKPDEKCPDDTNADHMSVAILAENEMDESTDLKIPFSTEKHEECTSLKEKQDINHPKYFRESSNDSFEISLRSTKTKSSINQTVSSNDSLLQAMDVYMNKIKQNKISISSCRGLGSDCQSVSSFNSHFSNKTIGSRKPSEVVVNEDFVLNAPNSPLSEESSFSRKNLSVNDSKDRAVESIDTDYEDNETSRSFSLSNSKSNGLVEGISSENMTNRGSIHKEDINDLELDKPGVNGKEYNLLDSHNKKSELRELHLQSSLSGIDQKKIVQRTSECSEVNNKSCSLLSNDNISPLEASEEDEGSGAVTSLGHISQNKVTEINIPLEDLHNSVEANQESTAENNVSVTEGNDCSIDNEKNDSECFHKSEIASKELLSKKRVSVHFHLNSSEVSENSISHRSSITQTSTETDSMNSTIINETLSNNNRDLSIKSSNRSIRDRLYKKRVSVHFSLGTSVLDNTEASSTYGSINKYDTTDITFDESIDLENYKSISNEISKINKRKLSEKRVSVHFAADESQADETLNLKDTTEINSSRNEELQISTSFNETSSSSIQIEDEVGETGSNTDSLATQSQYSCITEGKKSLLKNRVSVQLSLNCTDLNESIDNSEGSCSPSFAQNNIKTTDTVVDSLPGEFVSGNITGQSMRKSLPKNRMSVHFALDSADADATNIHSLEKQSLHPDDLINTSKTLLPNASIAFGEKEALVDNCEENIPDNMKAQDISMVDGHSESAVDSLPVESVSGNITGQSMRKSLRKNRVSVHFALDSTAADATNIHSLEKQSLHPDDLINTSKTLLPNASIAFGEKEALVDNCEENIPDNMKAQDISMVDGHSESAIDSLPVEFVSGNITGQSMRKSLRKNRVSVHFALDSTAADASNISSVKKQSLKPYKSTDATETLMSNASDVLAEKDKVNENFVETVPVNIKAQDISMVDEYSESIVNSLAPETVSGNSTGQSVRKFLRKKKVAVKFALDSTAADESNISSVIKQSVDCGESANEHKTLLPNASDIFAEKGDLDDSCKEPMPVDMNAQDISMVDGHSDPIVDSLAPDTVSGNITGQSVKKSMPKKRVSVNFSLDSTSADASSISSYVKQSPQSYKSTDEIKTLLPSDSIVFAEKEGLVDNCEETIPDDMKAQDISMVDGHSESAVDSLPVESVSGNITGQSMRKSLPKNRMSVHFALDSADADATNIHSLEKQSLHPDDMINTSKTLLPNASIAFGEKEGLVDNCEETIPDNMKAQDISMVDGHSESPVDSLPVEFVSGNITGQSMRKSLPKNRVSVNFAIDSTAADASNISSVEKQSLKPYKSTDATETLMSNASDVLAEKDNVDENFVETVPDNIKAQDISIVDEYSESIVNSLAPETVSGNTTGQSMRKFLRKKKVSVNFALDSTAADESNISSVIKQSVDCGESTNEHKTLLPNASDIFAEKGDVDDSCKEPMPVDMNAQDISMVDGHSDPIVDSLAPDTVSGNITGQSEKKSMPKKRVSVNFSLDSTAADASSISSYVKQSPQSYKSTDEIKTLLPSDSIVFAEKEGLVDNCEETIPDDMKAQDISMVDGHSESAVDSLPVESVSGNITGQNMRKSLPKNRMSVHFALDSADADATNIHSLEKQSLHPDDMINTSKTLLPNASIAFGEKEGLVDNCEETIPDNMKAQDISMVDGHSESAVDSLPVESVSGNITGQSMRKSLRKNRVSVHFALDSTAADATNIHSLEKQSLHPDDMINTSKTLLPSDSIVFAEKEGLVDNCEETIPEDMKAQDISMVDGHSESAIDSLPVEFVSGNITGQSMRKSLRKNKVSVHFALDSTAADATNIHSLEKQSLHPNDMINTSKTLLPSDSIVFAEKEGLVDNCEETIPEDMKAQDISMVDGHSESAIDSLPVEFVSGNITGQSMRKSLRKNRVSVHFALDSTAADASSIRSVKTQSLQPDDLTNTTKTLLPNASIAFGEKEGLVDNCEETIPDDMKAQDISMVDGHSESAVDSLPVESVSGNITGQSMRKSLRKNRVSVHFVLDSTAADATNIHSLEKQSLHPDDMINTSKTLLPSDSIVFAEKEGLVDNCEETIPENMKAQDISMVDGHSESAIDSLPVEFVSGNFTGQSMRKSLRKNKVSVHFALDSTAADATNIHSLEKQSLHPDDMINTSKTLLPSDSIVFAEKEGLVDNCEETIPEDMKAQDISMVDGHSESAIDSLPVEFVSGNITGQSMRKSLRKNRVSVHFALDSTAADASSIPSVKTQSLQPDDLTNTTKTLLPNASIAFAEKQGLVDNCEETIPDDMKAQDISMVDGHSESAVDSLPVESVSGNITGQSMRKSLRKNRVSVHFALDSTAADATNIHSLEKQSLHPDDMINTSKTLLPNASIAFGEKEGLVDNCEENIPDNMKAQDISMVDGHSESPVDSLPVEFVSGNITGQSMRKSLRKNRVSVLFALDSIAADASNIPSVKTQSLNDDLTKVAQKSSILEDVNDLHVLSEQRSIPDIRESGLFTEVLRNTDESPVRESLCIQNISFANKSGDASINVERMSLPNLSPVSSHGNYENRLSDVEVIQNCQDLPTVETPLNEKVVPPTNNETTTQDSKKSTNYENEQETEVKIHYNLRKSSPIMTTENQTKKKRKTFKSISPDDLTNTSNTLLANASIAFVEKEGLVDNCEKTTPDNMKAQGISMVDGHSESAVDSLPVESVSGNITGQSMRKSLQKNRVSVNFVIDSTAADASKIPSVKTQSLHDDLTKVAQKSSILEDVSDLHVLSEQLSIPDIPESGLFTEVLGNTDESPVCGSLCIQNISFANKSDDASINVERMSLPPNEKVVPPTNHETTSQDSKKSTNYENEQETEVKKHYNLRKSSPNMTTENQTKKKRKSVTFGHNTFKSISLDDNFTVSNSKKQILSSSRGSSKNKSRSSNSRKNSEVSLEADVFVQPEIPSRKSQEVSESLFKRDRCFPEGSSVSNEEKSSSLKRRKEDEKTVNLSYDTLLDISEIPKDKKCIYHSTPIQSILVRKKSKKTSMNNEVEKSFEPPRYSDKIIQVSKEYLGTSSEATVLPLSKKKSSDLSTSYSYDTRPGPSTANINGGPGTGHAKRKVISPIKCVTKKSRNSESSPQSSGTSRSDSPAPSEDMISERPFTRSTTSLSSSGKTAPPWAVRFSQKVHFRGVDSNSNSKRQCSSTVSQGSGEISSRSYRSASMVSTFCSSNQNTQHQFSDERNKSSKSVLFRNRLSIIKDPSLSFVSPGETSVCMDSANTVDSSLQLRSPEPPTNNSLRNSIPPNSVIESSAGASTVISELPTFSSDCTAMERGIGLFSHNTIPSRKGLKMKKIDKPFTSLKLQKYNYKTDPRFNINGKPYTAPKFKFPAKWVSKELYKYLIDSLSKSPHSDEHEVAERLISHLCATVSSVETLSIGDDIELATFVLKKMLVKYGVCSNHLEYLMFIMKYIPFEFQKKLLYNRDAKLGDPLISESEAIDDYL